MTEDNSIIERALRSAANELMELARQLEVGVIDVYVSPDMPYYSATAWKDAGDDESLVLSIDNIKNKEE